MTALNAHPFVDETLPESKIAARSNPVVETSIVTYQYYGRYYGRMRGLLGLHRLYFMEFKSGNIKISRQELSKALACAHNMASFFARMSSILLSSPEDVFRTSISPDGRTSRMWDVRLMESEYFEYQIILLRALDTLYQWEETGHVPAEWSKTSPANTSEALQRAEDYMRRPSSDEVTWPSAFIFVAQHILQVHARGFDEKWWKLWDELRPVDTDEEIVPFVLLPGAFLSLDDIVLRRRSTGARGEGLDEWQGDESAVMFPAPREKKKKVRSRSRLAERESREYQPLLSDTHYDIDGGDLRMGRAMGYGTSAVI